MISVETLMVLFIAWACGWAGGASWMDLYYYDAKPLRQIGVIVCTLLIALLIAFIFRRGC